jgi:hypothetical protein
MNECKHCGEEGAPAGDFGACEYCIALCKRCDCEIAEPRPGFEELCDECRDAQRPLTERDAFGPGGLAGYQNGRGNAGGTWTGD